MKKQHIFIGGLHRSGTSLIHEIIKGHPAISGFSNTGVPKDEVQHLQSLFPSAKMLGGPGHFGFNPNAHMDENHLLATQENANKLFLEWGRYWDLSKNILIEKSPPNLLRTRFLQYLFPECAFIVIIRHPIAVGIATQKWRKANMSSLLKHSLVCYKRFFNDMPFLNKLYIIRYEELVLNPIEEIEKLLSWAGLDNYNFNIDVTDCNKKYFSLWNTVERDSFFSNNNAEICDQFDTNMKAYGYSLYEPFTLNNVFLDVANKSTIKPEVDKVVSLVTTIPAKPAMRLSA